MSEGRIEPEAEPRMPDAAQEPPKRSWYRRWFRGSLVLLGVGVVLLVVWMATAPQAPAPPVSAPSLPAPAPSPPPSTGFSLNDVIGLCGALTTLVGAATALVTSIAALLNAFRKLRGARKRAAPPPKTAAARRRHR